MSLLNAAGDTSYTVHQSIGGLRAMTVAHDVTNGINPAGAYGRVELKDRYNRNLGFALLCSIALHLGGILLYVALTQITAMQSVNIAPRPRIPGIEVQQQKRTHVDIGAVRQGGGGDAGGVKAIMGNLTAVDDQLVDTTEKIADFHQMSIAVATPGDGSGGGPHGLGNKGLIGGSGPLGDSITIKHLDPAAIKKSDEVVEFAEIDPKWDPEDLRRRISYPPIALRSGIEGVVIVRVLVDRVGRVEDVVVEKCDNTILCQEAVRAVAKTPFTPGVQNRMPVKTWVQVDVHFKIDSE